MVDSYSMENRPDSPLRILAFFAHPDDETMFLGGTLAFLADRNARDAIVSDFQNPAVHNYNMKEVFTDLAAYCRGG